MYLLLLVFGGLLAAAGIVLAASGVSLHDHAFDTTVMTPGVVAVVGGCLLIALGMALRVLQRIERSLALRPLTAPSENQTEAAPLVEQPLASSRRPFAQPASALGPSATVVAMQAAVTGKAGEKDDASDQIPVATQGETAPAIEEPDVAPAPKLAAAYPISIDAAVAAEARRVGPRNGKGPARVVPRSDMGARFPAASERPKGPAFDSLWPKGPRPVRSVPPPSTPAVAAPVIEQEQVNGPIVEPPRTAVPVAASEPVTVLKSGVVDGMAYSLYSDGSIEAQLPQGTLRFGSITELRNHIEQSA